MFPFSFKLIKVDNSNAFWFDRSPLSQAENRGFDPQARTSEFFTII